MMGKLHSNYILTI